MTRGLAATIAAVAAMGTLLIGQAQKPMSPDGVAQAQVLGTWAKGARPSFSLGRDPGCDLVFESELYPHVSARHCEIIFDRRAYVICDRSRHGTLVNDRPVEQQAPLHSGDWIRLGPRGPVLRFLGTTSSR